MTSTELKHQARLREWSLAIRDCRSSGLSVRQWCKENGITSTTYYRWERELLAGTAAVLPVTPDTGFVELPQPKQHCRNAAECSATLHIGENRVEVHQELNSEMLKIMIEALRAC